MLSQQKQTNQMLQQQLQTAQTKSPLEQAQEKESTDWLQQTSSPDFDITKTTGMSPYMNLFNRAKSNAMDEETPLPTGASWGGERNTALSEALRSQGARSREQEAAGGLQQAFGAKDAAMRGQTLPFLGLQQQRNLGLSDILSGRSMGLNQLYGKQVNQPSFLQSFLLGGLGAAGQIYSGAGHF